MDDLELAETTLLEALRRGDLTAVGDHLRDDFLITTAYWLPGPLGKTEWLAGLEEDFTLDSFTLRVVDSRSYGDTAVVLVESSQRGTHAGTRFSMSFRYTDTWVLERDDWQLAVRHARTIPPKEGPFFPL